MGKIQHREKKIWAMGGGKGGIGKSFMTANIALTLARMGKRVVVVDLDLGSANIHTCLGAEIPQKTLSDYFAGRAPDLNSLVNRTSSPNLSFISGANDSVAVANITKTQHDQLLKQIMTLPEEYVLLDLGAGTHNTTLDYFLTASRPIIAVTPEPTSIENAYRFIKSAFFRCIKEIENKFEIKTLVAEAMDHKNNLGIRTPGDLINRILKMNPANAREIQAEIEKFQVYLILNQVRTKNDVDLGISIQEVCKKYFGIGVHYVGYLDQDNAVWQSVRKRRPVILEHPYSPLVHQFSQIVKNLDEDEGTSRAVILRTVGY